MNGHQHPYVQAAIEGEVARLASAQEGERNLTLFKGAASLASLNLREGEIIRHLKPAADGIGLGGREFYATIKSGVKAGHANLRVIPESACAPARIFTRSTPVAATLPRRSGADTDGKRPAFFVGGDEGPRRSEDEVRRHVYCNGGRPVQIKVKRSSGYSNWYRVIDGSTPGWQAGKPDGFVPVPYVGAVDPFDAQYSGLTVCWPEGEKDCDTLGSAGLPAFTFGGTGDGLPDGVGDYLVDRHIVILADNDKGGRDHAAKKAGLAHPLAASVKIVAFPELPEKGADVSDFLKNASVADLERRVREASFWSPKGGLDSGQSPRGWRSATITASSLREKTFEPIKYVVPGYIVEGVTIFAGKPKIGKSWWLYDVCLASAAGRFVLGNIKPVEGDVLYLALEDSQRRLKQRLQKLWPNGEWPSRLTLSTTWKKADAGGIDDISEWCRSVAKPVLIVIDTLEKFRPLAKPHAPAYSTDYVAIEGLHKLAHELGIAIVVVHHVRKMEADDPFDMVSGTNGLTGAADTILILKRQAGSVTLFARGRDIEETETACQFNKDTCRWTLLGDAGEVHSSGQREAIIAALAPAGDAGLHISEIMTAIGRSDRNAVDQLLFKMKQDGDIVRVKRAIYADAGKIGKKERSGTQVYELTGKSTNLTDLTDLTGFGAGEAGQRSGGGGST